MAPLAFTGSSVATLEPTYPNYQTALNLLRFSITEPAAGYPVLSTQLRLNGAAAWDENSYYNGTGANKIPDVPFDDPSSPYFTSTNDPVDPRRQRDITGNWTPRAVPNAPLASADATQLQYTIVCLQRLANPLVAWDMHANPYITVDQMWIDLTTYNSEKSPKMPSGSETNEYNATAVPTPGFRFDTRQRGVPMTIPPQPAAPAWAYNNVYTPYSPAPTSGGSGLPTNGGGVPLPNATLGYLNWNYGFGGDINPASGVATSPYFRQQSSGLGQPKPPTTTANINQAEYYGDPTYPFPWLNWNDRPFVSGKELMLVPVGSPASMLNEMTVGQPGVIVSGFGGSPIYWPGTFTQSANYGAFEGSPVSIAPAYGLPISEFGHLPNVFNSPQFIPGSPNPNLRTNASPNFYRLFEYLHVPSHFVGTETWLPPNAMQGNATVAGGLPYHLLHPPANRVSRLRDPGRVNANSIFDPFVWQGVEDEPNAAIGATPLWRFMWNAICSSRFGVNVSAMDTNGAYLQVSVPSIQNLTPAPPSGTYAWPSIFRAPFRSYGGHSLVPIDAMRREAIGTAPTPSARSMQHSCARARRPRSRTFRCSNIRGRRLRRPRRTGGTTLPYHNP